MKVCKMVVLVFAVLIGCSEKLKAVTKWKLSYEDIIKSKTKKVMGDCYISYNNKGLKEVVYKKTYWFIYYCSKTSEARSISITTEKYPSLLGIFAGDLGYIERGKYLSFYLRYTGSYKDSLETIYRPKITIKLYEKNSEELSSITLKLRGFKFIPK